MPSRSRGAGGCTSPTAPEVRAKAVVNAGGPWVGSLIREGFGRESAARVRLVRGSHIVTRRLFEHDRAYIFQQADGRVVFAIPYEEDFTLIGTTDMEHEGAPGEAHCTQEERDYLLAAAREYFRAPVEVADIVWSYSGVRPLYDDGASSATAATRDYVINLRHEDGAAAVDVFGGKITTYRRLSEAVLAKLAETFPGWAGPGRRGFRFRAAALAWARAGRWRASSRQAFPFSMPPGRRGSSGATAPRRRRCWPVRARLRTWASGSAGT